MSSVSPAFSLWPLLQPRVAEAAADRALVNAGACRDDADRRRLR